MKALENRQTEILLKPDAPPARYADLVRLCIDNPPKDGFTPDQMRKRLRVLDALDGVDGTIEFEDSDADTVKDCVSTMRWARMDRELLEFTDAVEGMKQVPTKPFDTGESS